MRRLRTFHRLIVMLTLFAFGNGFFMAAIHSPAHAGANDFSAKTQHETAAVAGCNHDGDKHSEHRDQQSPHGCDYTCAHHWAALPTLVAALAQTAADSLAPAKLPVIERTSFFHPFRPPAL